MANGNRNRPTGGTIGLMTAVRWLGAVAWAGSWYLMYLEITRWHHVRPDLTFNKELLAHDGVEPRPGLPLLLLYVTAVVAPVATVATVVVADRRRR